MTESEIVRCNASLRIEWFLKGKAQRLAIGFTHLTGGRVGATRTYACGEGNGGALPQGSASYPSLKQESPCGSSGWGNNPLPEAPSVRAE